MKKLSMIVHSSLQQELADCLRDLKLETFMFTHLEEHSAQLENDTFLSARDKVVGYVPQVRVDIILENDRSQSLLQQIREQNLPFKSKGTYWLTELDDYGEL